METSTVSRIGEKGTVREPKLAIAVTTIGKGEFLAGYCEQADAEGLGHRLKIVVIPDRKSPPPALQGVQLPSLFRL